MGRRYLAGCFCGRAKSKREALLAVSTRGIHLPSLPYESQFVCNTKVLKKVASDLAHICSLLVHFQSQDVIS